MPQFDFQFWLPQILWLIFVFSALYFLMARIALPRVSSILEQRRQRISDDLAEAGRLRTESEKVMEAYQTVLGEARSTAVSLIAKNRETLKLDLDAERLKSELEITSHIEKSQARIESMKDSASEEIRQAASDTVEAIVRKLVPEISVADGDGLEAIRSCQREVR